MELHPKVVRQELRRRKSKDKTPRRRENLPTMGASSSKSTHNSSYHSNKRPPQLNSTIPAVTFYGRSSSNHRSSLVTPDRRTPQRSIFASSDEEDVIEISPVKKPINRAGHKRSPESERQKHISEFIDVTSPNEAKMSRSDNHKVVHREPPKKKYVTHYPNNNHKPDFNGFKNNLTPIKGSSSNNSNSYNTPSNSRDHGNIFEKFVSSTPSTAKKSKQSIEGLECKQCKYDKESCCEQMLICTNYIGKVIEKTSSLGEEKQRLLEIIGRLRDENSSMKDEYDQKWLSKFKMMLNSIQVIDI